MEELVGAGSGTGAPDAVPARPRVPQWDREACFRFVRAAGPVGTIVPLLASAFNVFNDLARHPWDSLSHGD